MVTTTELNEIVDSAIKAYTAGVEQDPQLSPMMLSVMGSYVALRLYCAPDTGRLLLETRLAIQFAARSLENDVRRGTDGNSS